MPDTKAGGESRAGNGKRRPPASQKDRASGGPVEQASSNEASSVQPDAEDADGLIPLIDPPGIAGQSELPGTHIDPKTFSLGVLATLAVAYSLYFARSILFPVIFAVILALLFRPVVRRLRKFRIPDAISSAVVIAVIVAVIGVGIYQLAAPATEFVRSIPNKLEQADEKVRTIAKPFREINEALATGDRLSGGEFVERAAGDEATGSQRDDAKEPTETEPAEEIDDAERIGAIRLDQRLRDAKARVTQREEDQAAADARQEEIVVRANTQPKLSDWVLSATSTFLAGAVICLVLLYFLLAAGDDVLNNVLHVLPTFREKRGVVELIYAAEEGMSKYLLTVTIINVCLGVAEGVLMAMLGVEDAALWGVMACAFNFIPYVGAIAGTAVVCLVSFLQFDSLGYALLPPFLYWSLTGIEGNFITPTVLGKQISLNPVMVFLSLAFWGWIWGVGGALIAVPLLAMTKIVCDQFKPLQSIGKLLEQ
ncbi:MAG: AI-2E family transporter [Planctomycetota bacterium]|nr:AI-2E family transporter [Planctomycetota bacterium]